MEGVIRQTRPSSQIFHVKDRQCDRAAWDCSLAMPAPAFKPLKASLREGVLIPSLDFGTKEKPQGHSASGVIQTN